MTTYPGLPGPTITDYLPWAGSSSRYAPGTEFQIGRIDMIANTGTYLDAPVPPATAAARPGRAAARVGRGARRRGGGRAPARAAARSTAARSRRSTSSGRAVLVRTGWDAHWRTEAYVGRPPVPHRRRGAVPRRAGRGAGRHRLAEHRQHGATARGPCTRCCWRRHPGAGAPDAPRRAAGGGVRASRRTVPVRGMGTFPVRAYAVLRGPRLAASARSRRVSRRRRAARAAARARGRRRPGRGSPS